MASAKQLAALKKARAARAKNLRKKPVTKKRVTTRRKAAPKTARKSNPSNYGVFVETKTGSGYLSKWDVKGPHIEESAGKALKLCRAGAEALKYAIFNLRPRGVIKVDSVIIGSTSKK